MIVTQRYSNSPSATQQIIALKQQISQLLADVSYLHVFDLCFDHRYAVSSDVEMCQWCICMHCRLCFCLVLVMLRVSNYIFSTYQKKQEEQKVKVLREKVEEKEERCKRELCYVSTLEAQAAQMRMVIAEKERKVEEFKEEKLCLENNCRSLQRLHDKLGVENEMVVGELSNLKIHFRNNKIQLKDALQQITALVSVLFGLCLNACVFVSACVVFTINRKPSYITTMNVI